MYAQLVQGGTTPDKRPEMDRIVTGELIPALHEEPGFGGALNLVDYETGEAMMVMLWETAEQARRPLGEYGQSFLRALAEHRSHLDRQSQADERLGGERAGLIRATDAARAPPTRGSVCPGRPLSRRRLGRCSGSRGASSTSRSPGPVVPPAGSGGSSSVRRGASRP